MAKITINKHIPEGVDITKFYSNRKVRSYNTPWIFTVGNRSQGKTFGWIETLIDDFIKNGRKFLVVRRYDEDLKLTGKKFFDNHEFKYPDFTFSAEGSGKTGTKLFINGNECGMLFALSAYQRAKTYPMAQYDWIFFDEFLAENNQYLKDEVNAAFSLYQTVARGNGHAFRDNVKFIFVANSLTVNNPYFIELGIRERLMGGAKIALDPDRAWVCEMLHNHVVADEIAKTPFGKMVAKTKYGEMALKNVFLMDSTTFIQSPPKGNSTYLCTLLHMGESYGVYDYSDSPEGCLYISRKVNKQNKLVYALTTEDHAPNLLLFYKNMTNPVFKFLKKGYEYSLVRFDSMDSKYMFLDFIKFT